MKKIIIIIDGKEIETELPDEVISQLTENKKTGYERVAHEKLYYIETVAGKSDTLTECHDDVDRNHYNSADYYSDKSVAENNARADNLYRQLRRFAVEHRENKIDWNDENAKKHSIYYSHDTNDLFIDYHRYHQYYGVISFDTYATAKLAIDTFKDELLWYFTEYKDSL